MKIIGIEQFNYNEHVWSDVLNCLHMLKQIINTTYCVTDTEESVQ